MGIVLFELTTLRRLFRRDNAISTMRAVKACEVPAPSSLVKNYPPQVEAIVLKALARKPQERYPSADALRLALEEVLASLDDSGAMGLGVSIDELFREQQTREVVMPSERTQADGLGAAFILEESVILAERSNLPVHKTRFIGRTDDLRWMFDQLEAGRRLLSLYGPPGTGKTRLALEYSRRRVESLRAGGGTWIVDLEGSRSAGDVVAAVARTLGIPLIGVDHSAELTAALSSRGPTLLILDRVEHLLDQLRPVVAGWHRRAAELVMILTGHERAGVDGEAAHEVEPLPLPEGGGSSEAVTLFMDRTATVRPGWRPGKRDQANIRRIVRTLDGIPLALELAAARMGESEPKVLLENLERRFALLTPAPGESTALLAALDWSWDLLTESEQSVLMQASVFHGGFDMTAADAVIDLTGLVDSAWVVDVLQRLRNKSLVRSYEAPEFPGEPRCRHYGGTRQYARRKLEESGLVAGAMARHAAYYLKLGDYWRSAAGDRRAVEGRRRIEVELPNIIAVHRRSLAADPGPEDVERAMRLALAIFPVIAVSGPFAGFLKLLDVTLEAASINAVPAELHGALHLARGHIRRIHGDAVGAGADLRTVLTLAREAKDRALAGQALTEMATLRMVMGQDAPADDMLRRALGIHRETGDIKWQGRTLMAMGNVCLMRGELEKARACFERALPRFKAVGARVQEGACLGLLGSLEQSAGRLDEAMRYLEEALAIHREVGAPRYEGHSLARLGSLHHERGLLEEALGFYKDALRALGDVGDIRWQGMSVGYVGVLFHELGRFDSAAKRLARAVALLEDAGDERTAAFFMGALAAARASAGDSAAADEAMSAALIIARRTADPLLRPALSVYTAISDVAEAMRQESRAASELLLEAAARQMARLEAQDMSVRSDLTDLYRLAVRLFRKTIPQAEAHAAELP